MAQNPAAAAAAPSNAVSLRTRLSYGIGCIGRDATYTLVTTYLMTYLTLAVGLSDWQLGAVGVVMIAARVWDAINDPMMGTIIDNTRSRWGKFKPYILGGALLNIFFTILLFSNLVPTNQNTLFVVVFALTYILWGMTYTMNDISYWGMLPSLTVNQREREKLTSTVRIGANVGLFAVTALVPILTAGRMLSMYRTLSIAVAALFIACQVLVVVGVQEKKTSITSAKSSATLKEMFGLIAKNDQLLAIGVALLLFNIGYYCTTGFGMYFFYFDYGVFGGPEFTYFAITIGVTQIVTLAVYPILSKRFTRRQLFTGALCMVVVAYLGFMATGYLWPMGMPQLIVVGFVLFAGQAVIQLLNYVMLADTVEYGQWKLGIRNESVIFSLRPFIDKLSGAIQVGVVSLTLVISGLNRYAGQISALENDASLSREQVLQMGNEVVSGIPQSALLIMRAAMLALPLIAILCSYWVYRKKYRLNEESYAKIISDLAERSQNEETK